MTKEEIDKALGFDCTNVLSDARREGRAVMRGSGYWARPITERMEVCDSVKS